MSEQDFWYKIRKELKKNNIKFQRFEDGLSEGIPDLCIFINGKTIWVELKNKKMPIRSSTCIKVGLRPTQRIWARQRRKDNISVLTVTSLISKSGSKNIIVHNNKVVDELYAGMTYDRLLFTGLLFENEVKFVEHIKETYNE